MEEAFLNKWPDPSQFSTSDEFHKKYTEDFGKAMAFKDLYNAIEGAEAMAQATAKQLKSPDKDYSLGTKEEEPTPTKSK